MSRDEAAMIREAMRLLDGWDGRVQTIDSYIEEQLGDCDSDRAPADSVFIKQAVYSCERYRHALEAFLEVFYHERAATVLRSDYTLYRVFAMLTLFKLQELGLRHFELLVGTQDPTKMHGLLSYIFDEENLEATLKQEWIAIYDLTFVEQGIIAPLTALRPRVEELLERLEAKAFGLTEARARTRKAAGVAAVAKKPPTRPRSPNITKPLGRPLPEPMRIDQKVLVGPEPTYLRGTSLAEIEAKQEARRQQRRQRAREERESGGARAFRLHETKTNVESLRMERERAIQETLDFDRSFYKPPPKGAPRGPPVKPTTASILREDSLYRKKLEAEAKTIKAYEAELRDASGFERWQKGMRDRDASVAREQVELKRARARASEENAKAAVQQRIADNRACASELREEQRELAEARGLEGEEAQLRNQQLVLAVRETRDAAPQAAVRRVAEQRRARRDAVKHELDEIRRERAAAVAAEQSEREERIRKLRAQQVHEHPVEVFDPTTTSGKGLLGEMSLVEMQERLHTNRLREEEATAQRRAEIAAQRRRKAEDVKRREEALRRMRDTARSANRAARQRARRSEEKERELERERRRAAEARVLSETEARHKAADARHARLAQEERQRRKAQMLLGAAHHAVEEKRFEQLLLGRARAARAQQSAANAEAAACEEVRARARTARAAAQRRSAAAKGRARGDRDRGALAARREALEKQKEAIARKKAAVAEQRARQAEAIARRHALNRYAQAVTEDGLARSRKHAAALDLRRAQGSAPLA